MKILLLGKNGQVGRALNACALNPSFPIGWELIAWDRDEGDLTNLEGLIAKIKALKPDAIINAAAYTQVDKAESESGLNHRINAEAPRVLASYCASAKIPLIHFSSDYVYEGTGEKTHCEDEAHAPQNAYGRAKALGDEAVMASGADYLIFRTSWVYSFEGKNFVLTMQRIGKEKDELSVVDDQVGSPTYAPDLAKHALDALMIACEQKTESGKFPSGVYHLSNAGFTTWKNFAEAILPGKKINGIATSAYPTPAKRPLNSRLSLEKLAKTFGIRPRPWQEALAECLAKVRQSSHG